MLNFKEIYIFKHLILRIPITIYPKHICFSTKEFNQQFNKNFKIIKEFPQSNMQQTDQIYQELPVFLSKYKRTQTYIDTPAHITMSQADAELLGYKQGQKVNFEIPYKKITLTNLKIRIKDYYLPDLFILEDEAKSMGIIDRDWGLIST